MLPHNIVSDLNLHFGSSALLDGWSRVFDNERGKIYYFNAQTGETTRKPPTDKNGLRFRLFRVPRLLIIYQTPRRRSRP